MSQGEQILQHMRIHKAIDPITALKKYSCFRLAARINDLRNEGYNVKTHKARKENKTFAVYTLEA